MTKSRLTFLTLLVLIVGMVSAASANSTDPTEIPVVQITSPNNGATVSGEITIAAVASHSAGIQQMEFFVENVSYGVDTAAPFELTVQTGLLPEGTTQIEARATSADGDVGSSVVAMSNGGTVAPSIVGYSPASSAELPLDGAIEITFDQAMDQDETSSAISFKTASGANIAGDVTWVDTRTARFKPTSDLSSDAAYSLSVDTAATSALGENLLEGLSIDFGTIGDIEVVSVTPLSSAGEVDDTVTVSVSFNRPVVPLVQAQAQAGLANPLVFSPTVAGSGRWVNTSTYVFQPDDPLPGGRNYDVTVSSSIVNGASATGATMAADYEWSFTTKSPSLQNIWTVGGSASNYYNGQSRIARDVSFAMSFDQPMDTATTESAISVVAGGSSVPLTFAWDSVMQTVTFTPTVLLDYNTSYLVGVDGTAAGQYGGTLDDPDSRAYTTVVRPAVEGVYSDYQQVQIEFTAPIDVESALDRLTFTPALPDDVYIWPETGYRYSIRFSNLDASTTYNLSLASGTVDPYGTLINTPYTTQFTTDAYNPQLWLNTPSLLLHPADDINPNTFSHLNIEGYWLRLHTLTPNELSELRPYDMSSYMPSGEEVWSDLENVSAPLNEKVDKPIYMTTDGTSESANLHPGLYLLQLNSANAPSDPEIGHTVDTRLFDYSAIIIGNANLTLKYSGQDALVWVTDLTTGDPLPNVDVKLHGRFGTLTATTDSDGVARFDDIAVQNSGYKMVAVTDHPTIFGAVVNGQGVVSAGNASGSGNFRPDVMEGYLYTERPIYRPGQTVSFKGIFRLDDDLTYTLPPNTSVDVTIRTPPQYETIYEETMTLSDLKSFVGDIVLDDSAQLGTYQLEARLGESTAYGAFEVAEYRKPTHQVAVDIGETDYVEEETINVTTSADYYSGGDVVGADVSWQAQMKDYTFRPSGAYSRYSFAEGGSRTYYYYDYIDCYYCYYDYGGSSATVFATGDGVTDLNGELSFTVVGELDEQGDSQKVIIESTVIDASGNATSGRSETIVHKTLVYPGIRTESYVGRVGEPLAIDLVALDWDENGVSAQVLDVSVIETNWVLSGTQWVQEETIIDSIVRTTSNNGTSVWNFTPTEGGSYTAKVTLTDANGNTVTSSTSFWVYGSGATWQTNNEYTFDLIADADEYVPGDTAELLIASPFTGGTTGETTALVTVERGRIKMVDVISFTGSELYELPITADMAPNVYVSVVLVGEDSTFKYGATQLNVDLVEQTLSVGLTADTAEAMPGDTVDFTVTVTDHAGNPVPDTDVSLALTDLAAMSLRNRFESPILDRFYGNRALSFMTTLSLRSDIVETVDEEFAYDGIAGAPIGEESALDPIGTPVPDVARSPDGEEVEVREEYKDTAAWRGQVRTGANGTATISVELPDNLTTWQLHGKAITFDSRVGDGTSELLSTKPLLINPMLPRFFVVGDHAQVGATVHNNTDGMITADVTLDISGAQLDAPQTQVVNVAANSTRFVTWNITVEDVERIDALFSVSGSGYADAARPELATLPNNGIPVYKYEVMETVGTSGQLLDEGALVESISLPTYDDYTLSTGELVVEVAPSLAAAMTEGLDYLEHYDWECTEQIVSKFLPNVISTRALREAGVNDPALEANLEAQVAIALGKLAQRVNPDGGFGWWGNNQSNTLTTAWVVLGLLEAQEAGYTIDTGMLAGAVNFLEGHVSAADGLSGTWRQNRQAFVRYVLVRADGTQQGTALTTLYTNRENLSIYALGFLAQAMQLENPADSRLATLESDLMGAMIVSASGTHWEESSRDYWNWNSDTRTTAIVLDTMSKLNPTHPQVANATRWLMAHRENGYWGSTQDTAWTLMGLTNWMIASGELNPDYDYEVALNGSLEMSGSATSANVRDAIQLRVDISQMLLDEMNRLAVGRTAGDGNLYYTAFMDMSLPVEYIDALDRGFALSRSYFDPNDPETPVTSAEQGDILLARLSVTVPSAMHYVAIEDWLPAGLEIVDESLNTSQQVGTPETYNPGYGGWYDWWWGGSYWWVFDHVDLRDEKVQLSADYLWQGTYEYTYLVRAVTPGEYRVIPPTAQEFYFPDVYGRGDGSLFTVHPAGGTYTPPSLMTTTTTRSASKVAGNDVATDTFAPEIGADLITVNVVRVPTAVSVEMIGLDRFGGTVWSGVALLFGLLMSVGTVAAVRSRS